MGRGYMVDDAVETYLAKHCVSNAVPVTGLLIGQSSAQRDFVIMATRTPKREETVAASETSLDSLDLVWITEHARQVSRMLPGGMCVLGVFVITDSDAKDMMIILRKLVFAVDNLISEERLWSPSEDDVTDHVALHINPTTMKTLCRTFDVKDPKSSAKPADWRYQPGVCTNWSMVSCSLEVEIPVVLPEDPTCVEHMETFLKVGLRAWAHKVEQGICLIDGKRLPDDADLTAGPRRSAKPTFKAQLLVTPSLQGEQREASQAQQSRGTLWVQGAVHSRAYMHNSRPKAKLAERLLKRDMVSTVAARVQMMLEELLTAENDNSSKEKRHTDQLPLPRRMFCPVGGAGPVCVCDYQFSDEGVAEVIDRLMEIMDVEVAEEGVDTSQEMDAEAMETRDPFEGSSYTEAAPLELKRRNYAGVAIAAAIGLLATAASLLFLD